MECECQRFCPDGQCPTCGRFYANGEQYVSPAWAKGLESLNALTDEIDAFLLCEEPEADERVNDWADNVIDLADSQTNLDAYVAAEIADHLWSWSAENLSDPDCHRSSKDDVWAVWPKFLTLADTLWRRHDSLLDAQADRRVQVAGDSTDPPADGKANAGGNPRPTASRALEALIDDEDAEILKIALSDASADDRLRAIYRIDNRVLPWGSPRLASLLNVSEGMIRKSRWWRVDRPALLEKQRDDTG